MDSGDFTRLIKAKGWKVKDALEYWGRGQDWYAANRKGDEFAKRRLKCMINGLEVSGQQWGEFGLPIIQDRDVPTMPNCKPPKPERCPVIDGLINRVDKIIAKIEGAGR